jgi:membrane protein
MTIKDFSLLLRETVSEWSADNAPQLGAALAYYSVFSIAPLLIIGISISGLALGQEAVQGRVVEQLEDLVGRDAAQSIQGLIASARRPAAGIWATVIGIATLLLGASAVFGQLRASFDVIWDVAPDPNRSIFDILRGRFLAFAMVVGAGFLLLISLLISAGITALTDSLGSVMPVPGTALRIVDIVSSLAVTTAVFALIFKFMPNVRVAWRDVWIGAAMTSLLFTIGKVLIGLYLGRSGIASAYGAAGAVVVILLWVYYSSQILFFGAEFTQVYAARYGSKAPQVQPRTGREAAPGGGTGAH